MQDVQPSGSLELAVVLAGLERSTKKLQASDAIFAHVSLNQHCIAAAAAAATMVWGWHPHNSCTQQMQQHICNTQTIAYTRLAAARFRNCLIPACMCTHCLCENHLAENGMAILCCYTEATHVEGQFALYSQQL